MGQFAQCGYFERSQTGLGLDVLEQHFEQVQEERMAIVIHANRAGQVGGTEWEKKCWFKILAPPV